MRPGQTHLNSLRFWLFWLQYSAGQLTARRNGGKCCFLEYGGLTPFFLARGLTRPVWVCGPSSRAIESGVKPPQSKAESQEGQKTENLDASALPMRREPVDACGDDYGLRSGEHSHRRPFASPYAYTGTDKRTKEPMS